MVLTRWMGDALKRAYEVWRSEISEEHCARLDRARALAMSLDPEFADAYAMCKHFTMSGMLSMCSLYEATKYVVSNKIRGDIVECGVWKGGSIMLICRALLSNGDRNRRLYLYDTFEGMTKPTDRDYRTLTGESALRIWSSYREEDRCTWAYSSLEETRKNVHSAGYDSDKIAFVKGRVEETLPKSAPAEISLLRLDTDFYESTRHELEHLFPRVTVGGVIAIDDYGSFKGCQDAVDEYFAENGISIFLSRVDNSGYRIGIKQGLRPKM